MNDATDVLVLGTGVAGCTAALAFWPNAAILHWWHLASAVNDSPSAAISSTEIETPLPNTVEDKEVHFGQSLAQSTPQALEISVPSPWQEPCNWGRARPPSESPALADREQLVEAGANTVARTNRRLALA